MTSTGPAVVVPQNTVATETKKQPPPEPLAHQRRRMVVVFSFWAVVLFLGIPIWWKLTAIHRAALPLEQMQQWSDGRVSVRASSISDPDAETLVRLTQHAIDDLNDFSGHHLRLQLDSSDPAAADSRPAPALTIDLKPGDSISANLDSHTPVLSVTYPPSAVPSHSAASSSLATYIASELQATFAEERAILLYLTSEIASPNSRGHGLSAQLTEALDKRTTRLLQYAPTYHLTFSLFTAGATPNGWDVESAIRQYIEPMLTVLKPIHNFTIDTQVQLYSPPGVHSPVLGKEDLSSFINGAEWSLPPAIGEAPTINFILFVGNQTIQLAQSNSQSEPGTSQSWLIPKWGSVYLLPLPSDVDYVPADILKDPMLTFTGHLLSLLGTPQSGFLPLRLSTLSRALEHARIADAEAERAFFEKSMVGQLYFPDEHKIAVYLPLLGPVGTALFMGLISEVKAWKKRRREKTLAKAQKSQ
ncbi:hypothetical protein CFO_g3051 [Ceratocystis platani]|uniref:GPI transamidase component PIG-S n=1 Tax=Ceratocystis fimbriata f. sp. platani TaxID=88771 RepID=A0A0F8B3I5_CERFI|nr:hypothetical protein CFO_g3051 [Ceratocystis platani]